MKTITILLFIIIFDNFSFSQVNDWDPDLYGVNKFKVNVSLCRENKDYEFLEYEITRNIILELRNNYITVEESKDCNFNLYIIMMCQQLVPNSIAVNINFSLREKVYIKRIKTSANAILFERNVVGYLPSGLKGDELIKQTIDIITKDFIRDYLLDNPKN